MIIQLTQFSCAGTWTELGQKVEKLKEKVLNTLKVSEKKKRDLSCESVRSGCSGWGPGGSSSERDLSTDSRGEIRQRSEDEEFKEDQPSKSLRRSRSLLQPPKIVISK